MTLLRTQADRSGSLEDPCGSNLELLIAPVATEDVLAGPIGGIPYAVQGTLLESRQTAR